jgi:predicted Zn-dependent peptidase
MRTKQFASLFILSLALAVLISCGEAEKAGPDTTAAAKASIEKLPNGLKLIVRPQRIAGSPLVTLAIRSDAGLDQETPGEIGFSSLLARLLSGGDDPLRSLGAQTSVELLPDGLQIVATVLADDAAVAAESVVAKLTSSFNDQQITAERDSLVSAIEALQASSSPSGEELIDEFLIPRSPYGVSLDEKLESLRRLTLDSFRKFANRCLRPERTAIVATGALTVGVVETLKAKAGTWQPAAAEEPFGEWLRNAQVVPVRIMPRPGNEATLLLAHRTVDPDSNTIYPMLAVNFILNGRTTYSRLLAVQMASALETPVTSTLKFRPNGSCQIITTAAPATKAAEVVQNIQKTLETLHQGGDETYRILDQEISDAKNSLRGGLLRRTETTESLARFILWSEANGFPSPDVSAHMTLIDGLDKERLLKEISEHFDPTLYILIAIGPENILRRQFESVGEIEVVKP